MTKRQTIDQLLCQALKSFAEAGYNGASLRTIVGAAGVPLATVHNYFASKEALYLAVVEGCLAQVNSERLKQLGEARRQGRLTLRQVVDAIIDPVAKRWVSPQDENRYFVLLIRQLGGVPARVLQKVQINYLDSTATVFADALREVLPRLSQERAIHFYAFVVSSAYHALAQHDRLARVAGSADDAAHISRLVTDLKLVAEQGIASMASPVATDSDDLHGN